MARPTTSRVERPSFWSADLAALSAALPVVLGHELDDGSLEGRSVRIATPAEALSILEGSGTTLEDELRRQVLVAKLNQRRGLESNEDVRGALVYGTTTSVRSTLKRADAAVAGVDLFVEEHEIGRFVELLTAVNAGELTYQQPGVPFPAEPMADDDGDGVTNLKDNCPTLENPLQEDTDDDRIGDACRIRPEAVCTLARSEGRYEAVFGYESSLSFRSLPLGSRNMLERLAAGGSTELDTTQPTEFVPALSSRTFRVPFATSESVKWTVEGESVVATTDALRCSGRELAQVDFAGQVALFGSESVELGDYTNVWAPTGLSSVVSGGDVNLGANALVDHVVSAGRMRVGRYSVVFGSAVAGGGLEREAGADVEARTNAVVRRHSLDWLVDFGPTTSDVTVEWDEVRSLPPGSYGRVVIAAGGTLILAGGRYEFDELYVEQQATFELDSGDVVVHVASALEHSGETRVAGTTSLVLGYLGSDPAWIEASFHGTVIAPRAQLTLGSEPNSVFTGAFFARRISVSPGTLVEFSER